MLSLKSGVPPVARTAPSLDPGAQAFLNHLRLAAMACRSKPRADLFEACALLQVTRSASCTAHTEALMRCLAEALGKPARLHTPGTAETSFDEKWLLQLGRVLRQGDSASAAFLLGARVGLPHRRLVRYLMGRIAECFSLD